MITDKCEMDVVEAVRAARLKTWDLLGSSSDYTQRYWRRVTREELISHMPLVASVLALYKVGGLDRDAWIGMVGVDGQP